MKRLLEKLLSTMPRSTIFADILVTIPRVACGLLLTLDFGSSKFGVPWSGNNLPLFGKPKWFAENVAAFGGLFAVAPYLFA
ncbi:MAG: hypothetical protein WBB45_13895 [Cyclobacteriaceae bacterium]